MKNENIIWIAIISCIIGMAIAGAVIKKRPGCDIETCTMVWETLNC